MYPYLVCWGKGCQLFLQRDRNIDSNDIAMIAIKCIYDFPTLRKSEKIFKSKANTARLYILLMNSYHALISLLKRLRNIGMIVNTSPNLEVPLTGDWDTQRRLATKGSSLMNKAMGR